MKIACLLSVLLCGALSSCALGGKKPLPERVDDFCDKYDTEAKITQRLAEWTKAEPNNPDPYVLAENAYSRFEYGGVEIGEESAIMYPGQFETSPRRRTTKLALATLSIAAEKFPHRLDIHFGRMYGAQCAHDNDSLLLAARDMLRVIQTDSSKMRWIDDAPLPVPLKASVPQAFHDRITPLLARKTKKDNLDAHALAVEGLNYAPGNRMLLKDAKLAEKSIDGPGAKKKK